MTATESRNVYQDSTHRHTDIKNNVTVSRGKVGEGNGGKGWKGFQEQL